MIIYTCLVRCIDGMPLSSTNAFQQQAEFIVQEGKNVVKILAKNIINIPPRLCVQGEKMTIHCVKDQSTCFFVACDPSYPHILAYSFLDELMKEFSLLYTSSVVNAVKRPFGFIEFDSYLNNVQQKYNNPRSLMSRLNLPDLTSDLNLNPPVYKNITEYLDSPTTKPASQLMSPHSTINISNGNAPNGFINKSEEIVLQMKPVSLYGRIALILTLPCILLDAYRGIVSLQASSLEGNDAPSILHSCSFLSEMIFLTIQMYCLRKHSRHRKLISLNCLIFVILLNFLIFDIRESFIVALYVIVSLCLCLATFKRTFEKCLPGLNI